MAAPGYPGIPLTTTFTPAPTCFAQLTNVYMTPDLQTEDVQLGENYFIAGPTPITSPSSCFPLSWEPNPFAWFSPGVCPSGYTAGCTSTTTTIFELTQTGAICCPSSWTCETLSYPPSSTPDWLPWIASYPCVNHPSGTITVTTTGSNLETGVFTTSGISVNAFGVLIRWQQTDIVSTNRATPLPSTSSSIPSSTSSATTSPTSSTKTNSTSSAPSVSLSSRAKGGIRTGVAALVAALTLFILR